MNRTVVIIGIFLAALVGGGLLYRYGGITGDGHDGRHETHAAVKTAGGHEGPGDGAGGHDGHDDGGEIKMSAAMQKQNGIVVAAAGHMRLGGVIAATGKVAVNADRIAHVSPRINGKVVAVKASLGDSVSEGQVLATLDSIELGEALNRYRQSRTKLALAQSNMERIKLLVDRKIAARKDILQAETEYRNAQTELHTDEDRLSLYGVQPSDFKDEGNRIPVMPLRSPIGGVVTEKHAIVGELADPSKSLFTVADLSSVWVLIDISERDLAKVHRGQPAVVTAAALPELKLRGRVAYVADQVDEATRTVKARIELANPGRKLKPEMFATIELALSADARTVLAVPEEAVQDMDGRRVVFVAEDADGFVARTIQTGRAAGGMIEILSGLKEGERYAAGGSFILKSELKKGEMKDEHGH